MSNVAQKIETPLTLEHVVYNMLIEGTGIAMCDSGGIEGRGWQRNRKRTLADFQNDPEVAYEVTESYKDWKKKTGKQYAVDYTISLFHYLAKSLELDSLCESFNTLPCNKFESEKDAYDIYGLSDAQEVWLSEFHAEQQGKAWNSCNGDDALSQVLQGAYVDINDNHYVILQIHNGADVRGGYTDPKMFKLGDEHMPMQDVDGEIDGKPVSNRDSFPRLTWENRDTGCSAGEIELKRKPKEIILNLYTGY